ncbi:hypothetical protein CW362_39790 [Streptomyces populi]|uniref:Uncharacterized protein n=2 Tax=Streptomyces populi TaxID=2058924 RepID=A0A2I0SC87_9ACTN|nr:hypothetical protein CW362_39790 [Streptomyces populi]
MPRPATPAPDSAVQVRIAESTRPTPERCIRLVLEVEIFQDPDGDPDSLVVTTDELACEPTVPARVHSYINDARAKLDQMERLVNEHEAQDTLRAIVEEHQLLVEEWDIANLDAKWRDKFVAFAALLDDGRRVVVVPLGQDPVRRLGAVVELLGKTGLAA